MQLNHLIASLTLQEVQTEYCLIYRWLMFMYICKQLSFCEAPWWLMMFRTYTVFHIWAVSYRPQCKHSWQTRTDSKVTCKRQIKTIRSSCVWLWSLTCRQFLWSGPVGPDEALMARSCRLRQCRETLLGSSLKHEFKKKRGFWTSVLKGNFYQRSDLQKKKNTFIFYCLYFKADYRFICLSDTLFVQPAQSQHLEPQLFVSDQQKWKIEFAAQNRWHPEERTLYGNIEETFGGGHR